MFSCPREPGCADGPGPDHWRHVRSAKAAAIAPAWVLANLYISDAATVHALARRVHDHPDLLDRLVLFVARGYPTGWTGWSPAQWPDVVRHVCSLEAITHKHLVHLLSLERDDTSFTRLLISHPAVTGSILLARAREARGTAHGELIAGSSALGGICVALARSRPAHASSMWSLVETLEQAGEPACEVALALLESWTGSLEELGATSVMLLGAATPQLAGALCTT